MNKHVLNYLSKASMEDLFALQDLTNQTIVSRVNNYAQRIGMELIAAQTIKETKANVNITKGKIVKVVEEKIVEVEKEIIVEKEVKVTDDKLKAENYALKETNHMLENRIKEYEKEIEQLRKENARHLDRLNQYATAEYEREIKAQEEAEEDNKQYEIAYCGSCYCDTKQEIVNNGAELKCTECGEYWERFTEEGEDTIEPECTQLDPETVKLECISYKELPDNNGYSFLYTMTDSEQTVEFTAVANRYHELPIVFDACPEDIELLEIVKQDINSKVGIYNTLENDYAPKYRYHRSRELFIYFDEVAEIFKGYYCGNGTYGGRAFVFDIKNAKQGPCSRSFRQLIKDHKAGQWGKFTTMNGKGTSITKWKDTIVEECRKLYKQAKHGADIDKALVFVKEPWKAANEKEYNAALRFLAQMKVEYRSEYTSYTQAIDDELRHIVDVRVRNPRYGADTVKKFQDRIHALKLTSLYLDDKQPNKPAQSNNNDAFADVEL